MLQKKAESIKPKANCDMTEDSEVDRKDCPKEENLSTCEVFLVL
jgi:hypothetical protein